MMQERKQIFKISRKISSGVAGDGFSRKDKNSSKRIIMAREKAFVEKWQQLMKLFNPKTGSIAKT